jgi:hypothetical protein
MRGLEAYLYSRRNIVGTVLAIGGLALHFVGIVAGPLWLPITIGLYAIGALLVPSDRGLELRLGAAQDASEIRAGLDRLLRSLQGKVADDLYAKVVSIQGSILATLNVGGAPGEAADPNVYLIRQTALSYLPDAFTTYLRLPRAIAERRRVADGRTPHDVLLDQLDLMDHRLLDVADDIARHDSDKLLANGRFLAEKFGTSSLQVGDAVADAPVATDVASGVVPAVSDASVQPIASEPAKTETHESINERERVH